MLFVFPCAQPHITPHRLGVLLGVDAQPLSLCDELSIRALAVNGHYYLQALGYREYWAEGSEPPSYSQCPVEV